MKCNLRTWILILGLCVATVGVPTAECRAASELDKQLYEAVQFQDVPKIKELLGKGANVNYSENERSLLGWAAQSGNLEVVQALIAAHPDVNSVDGVGHTPLIRAIETQQTAIVKVLIAAKANANVKDREGRTSLMKAAESRKPEIVQAVIDGGADVKAITADGDSPALVAAQGGAPESLEIIKNLGAAKTKLDASKAGYTPLSYAISQENKALVKALLDAGADPNAKTASGRAPLHEAASNAEIFQMLLQAKADPNITNDRGETPLFVVVEQGTPENVEALLKAGADINKKDSGGNSALTLASNLYKEDMIALLKKNGAIENTQ